MKILVRVVEIVSPIGPLDRLLLRSARYRTLKRRATTLPSEYPPRANIPAFPTWVLTQAIDGWPEYYTDLGGQYYRLHSGLSGWQDPCYYVSLYVWKTEDATYAPDPGPQYRNRHFDPIAVARTNSLPEAEAIIDAYKRDLEVMIMETLL